VRRVFVALLLACSARDKAEVPILNYHSVGKAASNYVVPAAAFEEQLDWLGREGFRTVSLHELAEARAGRGVLPKRAVILTFDDGRTDALSVVLPLLRKRGMRATFFIGSIRDRIVRRHHSSMNCPAACGEMYVQKNWKSSLRR